MAKHTPTPWKFIDATKEASMQYRPVCVIQSGERQIASFSWNNNSPWFPTKSESQANAAFIVKAVNSHDALLAAAEKVLAGLNARIDAADKSAVPVFDGIAELHSAIHLAKAPA